MHKRNVEQFFTNNTTYWESVYGGRDQTLGFNSVIMEGRRRNVLRAVDAFAGNRVLRVLDVGCGPGIYMEEMLSRGHRATGLDLSPEMVAEANSRLRRFGGEPFCATGTIESLPVPDGSMDLVLCLGVLMYLKDEQQGIREVSRVLKQGGMAVVVMTNLLKIGNFIDPYYYLCRGWQYLWYELLKGKEKVLENEVGPDEFELNRNFAIKRYRLGAVAGMFTAHGLRNESVLPVEYGPPTFWKKSLFPLTAEIRISSAMDGLSRKPGFSWLKTLANEWVFCFSKQ